MSMKRANDTSKMNWSQYRKRS